MKTRIILRKYRKEDAKPICEIIKLNDLTVTSKDYPKEVIKRWVSGDTPEWVEKMSKKTKCFVLVDKDKIVGYLSLKNNQIHKLFVHPSFQRKGYGQKLVNKAINLMKKEGAKTIKLYSNLGARGFYSKCGFNLIRKIKKSEGRVSYYCFLMRKKI